MVIVIAVVILTVRAGPKGLLFKMNEKHFVFVAAACLTVAILTVRQIIVPFMDLFVLVDADKLLNKHTNHNLL